MVDSIIQGVTDYFLGCPFLKDGVFRVDALGAESIEYAIETGMMSPVLQRYVDGSSVRQYLFSFCSREAYGMDRLQNIQNSTFYEDLCDWVEEQNKAGKLPEMPKGCEARKLIVQTSGYLFSADMETARYQLDLILQYFKEG